MRGPTLRILSINDVYTLENLPRFSALARHHRETDPADLTLITLAGDFCAPSLLSGLDAGRGMIDCLNAIGVTHLSLGNHEDDIATEALHQRIAEFRGTWLSTNVRGFDDKLLPEQILQIGRVRLGLVGVVMDDAAAYRRPPFGGAPLTSPNATALEAAEKLTRENGCACVIPLTHQSAADDRALALIPQEIPFPLIVGGHEHTVFLEEHAQPGASGHKTWLIKAGADAERAVIADLSWPLEAPGSGPDLPSVKISLEEVASYPEDPAIRALVDSHLKPVHELEHATLLVIPPGETLSSVGTRRQETSLGARICSLIRDSLGAEVCLINGGGIRANRSYQHHVTYADIKAELPFENAMVVAQLPGSVVRDAIAASRARAPAESGGFLQTDDRAEVQPATHRLHILAGAPLEEDRIYRVALVRDLFGGMDHQEPLLKFATENPGKIPPAEAGRDVKHLLVDALAVALWKQLGGFDRVDLNHDGVVSEEELAAAVARVSEDAPSALAASLLMHALDADGNDLLSREEAAKAEK